MRTKTDKMETTQQNASYIMGGTKKKKTHIKNPNKGTT